MGALKVALRSRKEADEAVLFEVYTRTRTEELALVPWTQDQKAAFLRQQFQAQDHAYKTGYSNADFMVVTVDGVSAGRLYLHRRAQEIRVMDIALLPRFRNQGIGSAVLREVMREGAQTERIVTIHVELFNPALRLYERLGFQRVASGPVYLLMEWQPPRGGGRQTVAHDSGESPIAT